MKRILFLLLLTVSVYGQNPSRFAKIQITGNANSATATKVNVQEANGEVNTQAINTAFNKNFGLNSGDVVGANTLLNQYSTTPVDWTATAFNSGQVVFYGGKQWIAKIATVAGDVPSVSSKWEEITFEALANKTVIVDATPTDGSNNAVSSNGVFDALATKAPISSVHNPVSLGTANGLSLATQQLSLGLASSSTTGALSGTDWNTFNGKLNTPTGLTTNYLPKWNGSGLGDSSINEIGNSVVSLNKRFIQQSDVFGIQNAEIAYFGGSTNVSNGVNAGGFGVYNKNSGEWYTSELRFFTSPIDYTAPSNHPVERMRITPSGRVLINKTDDDLTNQLQVAGTISASPATTANQVVVKSQLDAVASSGTYTPSNQTNAAQTVNFIRSYWKKNGNVLTVTTSLTYTVTQIQSTSSFLITLPNGFLVSGANNGNIIGSSLLHNTQGIFNNNANMKAYEASDSSKINLQANFQAPVSSGTYETTIIYTVLIQ